MQRHFAPFALAPKKTSVICLENAPSKKVYGKISTTGMPVFLGILVPLRVLYLESFQQEGNLWPSSHLLEECPLSSFNLVMWGWYKLNTDESSLGNLGKARAGIGLLELIDISQYQLV
ncbi:hypothetical protein J1N35_021260 [Gossypium stocksii]|uniref:Uncharacterized protein n=1 Tax=Gossypium stocksii TaxID=47602 RepID=A0A9D3VGF2_9ROSI|nr:hypothetical protein J1N35_021260 [Gossypium stocksii]